MDMDYTNLQEVLMYLSGPAGMAAMGVFVSDFFRNLEADWWTEMAGQLRTLVPLGVYVVLAAALFAVVNYVPADVILGLQPFYAYLVTVYLGGRGAFELLK